MNLLLKRGFVSHFFTESIEMVDLHFQTQDSFFKHLVFLHQLLNFELKTALVALASWSKATPIEHRPSGMVSGLSVNLS